MSLSLLLTKKFNNKNLFTLGSLLQDALNAG